MEEEYLIDWEECKDSGEAEGTVVGGGGGEKNSEDLMNEKAWEKVWEGAKREGGVDFAWELSKTSW